MKLSPLLLMTAAASLAPVLGCASDVDSADGSEDVGSSEDALSTLGHDYIGAFDWNPTDSGTLVDFEHVELKADGTYTAKVEATLVNPGVRCFRFPCTLPESGRWNVYKVSGRAKLRVRPTTGRARVYTVAIAAEQLTLSRLRETTTLFREAQLSCANVRCAAGTHCEMTG